MAHEAESEDRHIERWIGLWNTDPGKGGSELILGPGDDCAVLGNLSKNQLPVLKTDAIVQDVHFRLDDAPKHIGHKALGRLISDFAAMGAQPHACLVTVGLPGKIQPVFIDACYKGMARLAQNWKISLAGGETTRSRELWFSLSLYGSVPKNKVVTRSGSKPGDLIFVTGRLGGSFPRRHLRFTPRLEEGQWLAQGGWASAMMDLSDGLGKDLPRLARSSNVSFHIQPDSLPRTSGCTHDQAVNDGEDYELLFTVRPDKVPGLSKTWPFKTNLSCIGIIGRPDLPNFTGGITFAGYDHFIGKKK